MTLDAWIDRATQRLAPESALRARSELEDFTRDAVDAAIARGVARDVAERDTLAALGNASDVNREYRRVFLTEREDIYVRALCGENFAASKKHGARVRCANVAVAVFFAEVALMLLFFLFVLPGGWLLIGVPLVAGLAAVRMAGRRRSREASKFCLIFCGACLVAGASAWWAGMQFWAMPIGTAFGALLPMLAFERFHARLRRKVPPSQWPPQLS